MYRVSYIEADVDRTMVASRYTGHVRWTGLGRFHAPSSAKLVTLSRSIRMRMTHVVNGILQTYANMLKNVLDGTTRPKIVTKYRSSASTIRGVSEQAGRHTAGRRLRDGVASNRVSEFCLL